jgi:hypothetical protein
VNHRIVNQWGVKQRRMKGIRRTLCVTSMAAVMACSTTHNEVQDQSAIRYRAAL